MSSQAHGRLMEDAAKKRRRYIFARIALKTTNLGGIALFLFSGLVTIGCFGAVFASMLYFGFRDGSLIAAIIGTVVSGLATIAGFILAAKSHSKSQEIPYVPPVGEQTAALPAEEVLLRGSDQPEAAPGELLRAAQTGAETEAEELLRADLDTQHHAA